MRAIFHWVTPTPKKWIEDAHPCSGGCCGGLNEMMIPEEVKQVLDHDEDGTISCSDVVWFLTHLHEDILPQMFSFSDAARERGRQRSFTLESPRLPRIDISLPAIRLQDVRTNLAQMNARARRTIFGERGQPGVRGIPEELENGNIHDEEASTPRRYTRGRFWTSDSIF